MKTLSIVIPALNEEKAIARVLQNIPLKKLKTLGYIVEVLVIDNGSTDATAAIARKYGAKVILYPVRGYGNAYKAGFAKATGNIIATGDADLTYPFEIIPGALSLIVDGDIDFINTDRLTLLKPGVMSWSHKIGNRLLTLLSYLLYGWPFRDSQSGMWIFRKDILKKVTLKETGMPFSQDLKIEAFMRGFKCIEIPIEYRARAGKEKLNTINDGYGNIRHLIEKKFRMKRNKRSLKLNTLNLTSAV